MKSLMLLLRSVLQDMEDACDTSTAKDLTTILRRVEHEGLSFLTITLADFGKDFQKSLDLGRVDCNSFLGFKRRAGLPAFLQGFLSRVFDAGTGQLLSDPDIDAIFAVRQLTLMWQKVLLPSSEERERSAMAGFIQCEKEMHEYDKGITPELLAEVQRVSSHLFGSSLLQIQDFLDLEPSRGSSRSSWLDHRRDARTVHGGLESGLPPETLRPAHGPGATADRLKGNQKYRCTEWTWRLEEGGFPSGDYLIPNHRFAGELDAKTHLLEPGAERPVRVISVPKTLKTPRIIAIEPTCMQYAQQALRREFYRVLESKEIPCSGMIGLTDQHVNRELARESSASGHLATLDMSEASDRVSNQLVRAILANTPQLAKAVDACRSRRADVPGYGVVRLAKFASMGSALTFPIEAMVFLTAVFIGISRELNCPVTPALVREYRGRVRVYGDDIIVPVEFVESVIRALSDLGQKVNTGKSFWTGKFRESCGGDYYDGWDVTPVRLRRLLPQSRADAQEIESAVALRNQLYRVGYWKSCRFLDSVIERLIPFPHTEPSSPALGRFSFLVSYKGERVHSDYGSPLVWAAVQHSREPVNSIDGYPALMKILLHPERVLDTLGFEEPPLREGHLERSGRPQSSRIKLRWVRPY